MRIGIDARLWNETGVGRYIRNLFKYLHQLDKENEYVWFVRNNDYENLKSQISNLKLNKWKVVIADVQWHSFAEQILLPWIFYKEKLDLFHFPYFSFPIFYPGKFVITIHDLIFDHYKTGKASTLPAWFYFIKKIGYHFILWSSVFRSNAIITLSKDSKKEIINHYHANPDKIFVTYQSGVLEDVRKTFNDKNFEEINRIKPYLLYVGNAHPHKNIEALILAMKYVRLVRNNLKLVLVGDDKFFYPRLKEFIQKNGVSDYVIVIGSVPNNQIGSWYHFAESFVTASKMEGFGIPPLEAMSLGCPAIVSDIPVFHEVYGDSTAYFNNNDPKKISEVILETLSDKKKIEELIKKGYKKSISYSWEKTSKETLEIYKKV